MVPGWVALLTALIYLSALFAVAHFGENRGRSLLSGAARPLIYSMALGVYCTSWTFFGSVGLASSKGFDFLPIYIGPILVFALGYPFILRIVRLAKAQNITSIADFVAARYGKSEQVAALVAIIAVIGAVPYIALQLKAISHSIATILDSLETGRSTVNAASANSVAIGVAIVLAGFAMAFGTRKVDATEHNDGLMLAVSAESIVKLIAFVLVGGYVTWFMFGGIGDLAHQVMANEQALRVFETQPEPASWITNALLAACCILLLPRQFHVTVVENREERDVRTAAWMFPLYLVAINIFVIPLAMAGKLTFLDGEIDRDMTVLALPLDDNAPIMALIAMLGGLSAATAMVIVDCVALSIMVSNDLAMPLLLRGPAQKLMQKRDTGSIVLAIRRAAIVLMLALGYVYFRSSSDAALSSIGLLSFAAIAQIAPAFLLGLFWGRCNARGAKAGLIAGILVWAYTLLLPSLASVSSFIGSVVEYGPFGITWLRPSAMFGLQLPVLVHGVLLSISANVLALVALSFTRATTSIESLQAEFFVGQGAGVSGETFRLWRSSVTVGELEATIARYLGNEPAKRAFEAFHLTRGEKPPVTAEADVHLFRFAEQQLASAIGAASSRLVLSLLLSRRTVSRQAALRLIDDASAALQYNRDLLQYALDFARQGITVFDKNLRLICWNREFRELFDLPAERVLVGMTLEDLLRFNAQRGIYGPGSEDAHVSARTDSLFHDSEPVRLRLYPRDNVIEIRSALMPDGGLVTTYTDVTEAVEAEDALAATNETLEQRVRERTEELVRLNAELERAKGEAEDANISKTRFLAAASHDLLQPLNAARLYTTTLVERLHPQKGEQNSDLAHNLDASLEAVEEILTALLDISRLDAGAMKPEYSDFRIDDVLQQLRIELGPMAAEKGLKIDFVPCSLTVRSDRRLLRRLLQNLISNAIKYTPKGRVLVGCRRRSGALEVQVLDTGLGIPQAKQQEVFREFERLAPAARTAPGLGLGLSIVERISRVLDHRIRLVSAVAKGSLFSVRVPVTANVAPVQQTAHAAPVSHMPLAGLCVLAIDNEPRILVGMDHLLSGWGCSVVCAGDLGEARNKVAEAQLGLDVIIADYHLDEGSDGLAAIAALRSDAGRDIPAILITADRTLEIREAATAQGVVVLNKPVKPAALRALLAQWRVQRAAE
jgi:Na+/proline symporter/signal transduction histidine kinase